jgi:hypothetical protein
MDTDTTQDAAATEDQVAAVGLEPDELDTSTGATTDEDRRPAWQQKLDRVLDQQRAATAAAEAQQRESEEATLRKGESWDSILAQQPEDVQRAMRALRADYTRKTQEVAAQRRQLEAAQAAMMESPVLSQLAEAAAQTGDTFDPWDPASLQQGIERMVASKLHALLQPMQRQHQQAQAQAAYQSFVEQHPELKTDAEVRAEVRAELERNPRLDLETAYWAVQGRRSKAAAELDRQNHARRKRALQAAGARIASGTRVPSATVQVDQDTRAKGDAWAIYQQLSRQG